MYGIPDVRQSMFVAGGIASEETAAAFITSASAKEVQILAENGAAVPTYKEDFFIAYKNKDNTYFRTNTIRPANIKYVNVATAITPIPTYSYLDVAIAGMAIGDTVEVMTQIYGFGTSSWHQRLNRVIAETFAQGDTTVTLAAKLGITLQETLARTFESKPSYTVYNKAGYDKVFETEQDVIDGKASLTNSRLIWVIANQKPYSVTDKSQSTFANICAEKTSWTAEIAATTAVSIIGCRYFDIVQKADTSNRLYVICKVLSQDDERKFGYESPVYVGAQWLDASNHDVKTDIGVTKVAERLNPGDGKYLRDMEVAFDKIMRPYGRFEKMGETHILAIDKTASYTVLTLCYKMIDGNTPHQLSVGNDNYHTLFIPFTSSADAADFLAAINATVNMAMDDLSDVTITSMTDDQVILADTGEWINGAVPSE